MNIKVGDMLVLRYPERDTVIGMNAIAAVKDGILTIGTAYKVESVTFGLEAWGNNSTRINQIRIIKPGFGAWVIDKACFETPVKRKRNLPEWF